MATGLRAITRSELSVPQMSRWLRDVIEAERRVIVLDAAISEIDRQVAALTNYQHPPKPKKAHGFR